MWEVHVRVQSCDIIALTVGRIGRLCGWSSVTDGHKLFRKDRKGMVDQGSSREWAAGAHQAASQNGQQAGRDYAGQCQKREQGEQLCGESLLLTTLSKEKVDKAPFQITQGNLCLSSPGLQKILTSLTSAAGALHWNSSNTGSGHVGEWLEPLLITGAGWAMKYSGSPGPYKQGRTSWRWDNQ